MARLALKISKEDITPDLLDESKALSIMHDSEVGFYGVKPKIEQQSLYTLQDLGMMHCYVARDQGQLVGYMLVTVTPDFQYSSVILASQAAFFVHPDHRGTLGIKMIKFVEVDLAGEADYLSQSSSGVNDVGPLFERLGYQLVEKKYLKKI